jgi:hypothetical protein
MLAEKIVTGFPLFLPEDNNLGKRIEYRVLIMEAKVLPVIKESPKT